MLTISNLRPLNLARFASSVLLTIFSHNLYAQQKGEVYKLGDTDNYVAAVKTDIFKYYVAEQEYDNWCWAACIQMVLQYQGLKITQCDIVKKAFGSCINSPASCNIMVKASNGWIYNGNTIESWQTLTPSPRELIDALAFRYPVIIGLNIPGQGIGHAYVLTGVYYTYSANGTKKPYKVVLRDPWPSNPSRLELQWQDFASRINCITHVTH